MWPAPVSRRADASLFEKKAGRSPGATGFFVKRERGSNAAPGRPHTNHWLPAVLVKSSWTIRSL